MSVHFDLEEFSSAFGSASGSQYNTDPKRNIFFDNKTIEFSRRANLSEAIIAYVDSKFEKGDYIGSEIYGQKNNNAIEIFLRQNPETSIEDLSAAIKTARLVQQATRNGRSLVAVWDSLAVSKTPQTIKILESTWFGGEELAGALRSTPANPAL